MSVHANTVCFVLFFRAYFWDFFLLLTFAANVRDKSWSFLLSDCTARNFEDNFYNLGGMGLGKFGECTESGIPRRKFTLISMYKCLLPIISACYEMVCRRTAMITFSYAISPVTF